MELSAHLAKPLDSTTSQAGVRGTVEGSPSHGLTFPRPSAGRWREVVAVKQKAPMVGAGHLRERKWQVGQR